jgi:glycosyltransferase involved in cell wall biosynthesis
MNSPARRIHHHGLQCLRLDSKLTPFCFTHLVTPINPLKLAFSLACSRFTQCQLPEIGSQQLATDAGARVALIPARGYGAALLGGIAAARGRYIIMGDADDSYDFSSLDAFVAKLREGHPLVMGNRFDGGIMPGAMPPLHRYLGNPVLSFIGRLLFRSPLGDFHCGLRGFDRAAILKLGLASPGMEFASEMIVKATLADYNIAEVPTILHPDGRSRPPHLRSWRDGWRHLRFLLMMSPRWLLLYPGCLVLASWADSACRLVRYASAGWASIFTHCYMPQVPAFWGCN